MQKVFLLIVVALLFGGVNSALADGHYTSVNIEAAKELHDRGVLFVDVRTVAEHAHGHIPNAIVIDVRSTDFVADFTEVVDKDQEVVFYCRGHGCSRSSDAISLVSPLGYTKLFLFDAGMPGWIEAGYSVAK